MALPIQIPDRLRHVGETERERQAKDTLFQISHYNSTRRSGEPTAEAIQLQELSKGSPNRIGLVVNDVCTLSAWRVSSKV